MPCQLILTFSVNLERDHPSWISAMAWAVPHCMRQPCIHTFNGFELKFTCKKILMLMAQSFGTEYNPELYKMSMSILNEIYHKVPCVRVSEVLQSKMHLLTSIHFRRLQGHFSWMLTSEISALSTRKSSCSQLHTNK